MRTEVVMFRGGGGGGGGERGGNEYLWKEEEEADCTVPLNTCLSSKAVKDSLNVSTVWFPSLTHLVMFTLSLPSPRVIPRYTWTHSGSAGAPETLPVVWRTLAYLWLALKSRRRRLCSYFSGNHMLVTWQHSIITYWSHDHAYSKIEAV